MQQIWSLPKGLHVLYKKRSLFHFILVLLYPGFIWFPCGDPVGAEKRGRGIWRGEINGDLGVFLVKDSHSGWSNKTVNEFSSPSFPFSQLKHPSEPLR